MINVGQIYKHPSGTTYRVDELLLSAEGYEETGALPQSVIYTQLQSGGYPAGTRYTRTVENFLRNFELSSERELPTDEWTK